MLTKHEMQCSCLKSRAAAGEAESLLAAAFRLAADLFTALTQASHALV